MTVRPPHSTSIARSRVSPRLESGLGETGLRGQAPSRLGFHPWTIRNGMTLTELLVVIMILAFLMGAALPIMRTALEDRAMREASRQLNTFVQLAKSQAADQYTEVKEAPKTMLFALSVTALVSIALFFYPDPFYNLAVNAAKGH